MRFYNTQHPFYCGIDLHARMIYVCILDPSGEVLVYRHMKTDPEAFLRAIAPYRPDIVVAVACLFTWYGLADLCADEESPFVLGHALDMKAIHGGKAKHDQIDSQKMAVRLRGGMLPQASVYPAERRATVISCGAACIWRTSAVNSWPRCNPPTARITCRPWANTSLTQPTVTGWPNALPTRLDKKASKSIAHLSGMMMRGFARWNSPS